MCTSTEHREPHERLPLAPEIFVDREAEQSALNDVQETTRQQTACVAIIGFSGLGKPRWRAGG